MVYSYFISLLCLLTTLVTTQEKPVVYLIGDSTCADKKAEAFPEMGWGTPFKTFFTEQLKIENRAWNGRSTKSFMKEGRWDDVLSTLKEGDHVFIQFGHNDEVPSKVGRYTTPDEFQTNLRKYVSDTRERRAKPVLLTPIARRSFEDGKLMDTHKQYAQLVREVAAEKDVPLIDMTKKSMALIEEWGISNSQLLYHHLLPGEHPNFPGGREDNTHFNELGARKMAQLILEDIRKLDLDLVQYVVNRNR